MATEEERTGSFSFQFPALSQEDIKAKEPQQEARDKTGLKNDMASEEAKGVCCEFKAANDQGFLGKEVPELVVEKINETQLKQLESHESREESYSPESRRGFSDPSVFSPWENAEGALAPVEGEAHVYQKTKGPVNLSTQTLGDSPNMEVTKTEDLLKDDSVSLEAQRTLFREFRYQQAEGPQEACSHLWYLCHRWLMPERHTKEQILELVILEQFLAILPLEIQNWVKGGCPKTCDQAVALVEDFLARLQEPGRPGKEGTALIREAPHKVRAAERLLPNSKEKQHCSETKLEVDGDPGSQRIIWQASLSFPAGDEGMAEEEKSQEENPKPGRCHGPSWEEPLCLQESEEASESPKGLEQGKKNYLESRVEVFFPYLEESGDVSQTIVVKRQHRSRGEKVCNVCRRSFSRTTVLVAHQRTHTGEKPFMCKDCGKCFSLKSTLVAHERTHTGERPYTCSQCGKSFTVSSDLTRHYRIHVREKPFSCLECGKSFSRKMQLLNHHKVHTREKPYKCAQCGETFSRSSSLMIHKGSHTGEKPFKCPDCEKSFNTSSQLVKHHRVHTGERPYTCSECGKSFSQRQILMVHQRIHTGEKPFKCSICGKCFCDRAVLIRHQKVHTGERPHECATCGKRFSHRAVLVRHQKIHTRETLNVLVVEDEPNETP